MPLRDRRAVPGRFRVPDCAGRQDARAGAQAQAGAQRAYIQEAAGTASNPAAEIERLANLRDQGAIDDAEFQALKAKALV